MRVLIMNSVCGTGSTGRIVEELYQSLESAGHICCVAYGRGQAPERIKTIRIGNRISVYAHGILNRLTDRHGFYSKHATVRFLKEVDAWKPDLIHLHNIHGYYIHIGLLFEYVKMKHIPIVWTLHDCWAITGHCAYFDSRNCERWKTGCFSCPQRREYPGSWLLDRSKWNYIKKKSLFCGLEHALMITPSRWMEEVVKLSYLGQYSIKTIYNGIDLQRFKPTESEFRIKYGLKNKTIILGVANIWESRKGLQCFKELSKILDHRYQIVMVGVSERQKRGMPEHILALPRTESIKELAEIYTAADVFLNASMEETMGLVTIEALACGTPVIAFDRTAISETFDSTCGVLITVERNLEVSPALLAGQVQKVIEEGRWKGLEEKDCLAYAELFDKKTKYRQYVNTLEGWGINVPHFE